MKTLIVYASNHGTTLKVAHYLAEKLPSLGVEIVDVKNIKGTDISIYDNLIIGASIHAGSVQRSIRNFCDKYKNILLAKPLALYLSCMHKDAAQTQFDKAFPEYLRNHAHSHAVVGGEFLFEEMNFFEKAIIKKIAKIKESVSNIDYPAIDVFVQEIQKKIL